MNEFDANDARLWVEIALKEGCDIQHAIHYCRYFECLRDPDLLIRAIEYFYITAKARISPEVPRPPHEDS